MGLGEIMIEYIFVMLISTSPFKEDWKYVGHFESCLQAHLFVSLYHPEKKSYRCMLEKYVSLPENTIQKRIDMKNNSIRYKTTHKSCKLKRSCNE